MITISAPIRAAPPLHRHVHLGANRLALRTSHQSIEAVEIACQRLGWMLIGKQCGKPHISISELINFALAEGVDDDGHGDPKRLENGFGQPARLVAAGTLS